MASRYEQFFRAADTDNSGYLTLPELIAILRKNGYSDAKAKDMFRSCDYKGDNKVTLDEFLEAMGQSDPQAHKAANMRRVFQDFDTNGDGTIDASELGNVFEALGQHHSPEEIQRMMALVDSDRTGSISYDEFVREIFGEHAN